MLIGYSLLKTIVQPLMAISFYLFVLIAFLLFFIIQAGQSDQPGPSRRRFELVDESVVSLFACLSILPLLKRISELNIYPRCVLAQAIRHVGHAKSAFAELSSHLSRALQKRHTLHF